MFEKEFEGKVVLVTGGSRGRNPSVVPEKDRKAEEPAGNDHGNRMHYRSYDSICGICT